MNLSPADKAMLITFGGACFLVLIFFFLGVKPYKSTNREETFIEIPLLNELNKEQKSKAVTRNKIKSHQAYNSSKLDKEIQELFEQEDLVRKAIAGQQLKSVQDLTAATDNALLESSKQQRESIAQHSEDVRKQIVAREERIKRRNAAAIRESSVSFNLINRTAVFIPNPVYTCDAQGEIVLDISVNNKGAVTQTSFNKKASTSLNRCLIDQALAYANDAFFSSSSKPSQSGSITFSFQN